MKISLIIPAYNEEGNINAVYDKVTKIFKNINQDYEIIFVNDGSIDNTEQYVLDLNKRDKHVKLISFTKNFGHQAALIAGYNHCTGDAVITMDCDLQHPPEMIPDLIKKWEEGFKIVNTIRIDDDQKNILKKTSSKYFYKLFSYLANIPLNEGSADFRLVDKKVVERINNLKEYDLFLRGMFTWFGFRSIYINYMPNRRFSGNTKYGLKKMINFALSGITSFSVVPLRLATILGFFVSGLSFIYIIYSLHAAIFTKNVVSGWTSVMLSILFLGGIQLIAIGILGEYIGKIYIEIKGRPRYIVKVKEGW